MYVTDLRLNEYAVFLVSLFDDAHQLVQREYVRIQGDEYENWGTDDLYIKQVVLGKFGLALAPAADAPTDAPADAPVS